MTIDDALVEITGLQAEAQVCRSDAESLREEAAMQEDAALDAEGRIRQLREFIVKRSAICEAEVERLIPAGTA
jgi:hypothetical protein